MMTRREFNKQLKACSTRGKLSKAKVAALPGTVKADMVRHIVRNRGPVLIELMTPEIDLSWLACCGYLHQTTGKASGYTFVHTAEHRIR